MVKREKRKVQWLIDITTMNITMWLHYIARCHTTTVEEGIQFKQSDCNIFLSFAVSQYFEMRVELRNSTIFFLMFLQVRTSSTPVTWTILLSRQRWQRTTLWTPSTQSASWIPSRCTIWSHGTQNGQPGSKWVYMFVLFRLEICFVFVHI